MNRLLLMLALLAVGGGALLTTANARDGKAPAKRAVCHKTSSKTRPYVKLRVSSAQYRSHLRHAADIVPAPGGACPRTLLTAASGGSAFTVGLTGEAESPAGDPVGTGTATVRARRGEGRLCFRLAASNITFPSTGAHIHAGGAGENGAVVVPLIPPTSGGAASGCVAVARAVVGAILADPDGHYVNVHTSDFPAGAVRGQLRGSAAELGRTFVLQLSGTNERPQGAGDPNGTGTATVRFRREAQKVCFRLLVRDVALPAVGAHIHRAPATGNGPIVVQLTAPGASGASAGCADAATTLIDEILANPAGFYVNVHTTEHAAGAVRAQLA